MRGHLPQRHLAAPTQGSPAPAGRIPTSTPASSTGAPPTYGEVLRRRLSRHRTALPQTTDPWTELCASTSTGTPLGRLQPDVVIIDSATGIYP